MKCTAQASGRLVEGLPKQLADPKAQGGLSAQLWDENLL